MSKATQEKLTVENIERKLHKTERMCKGRHGTSPFWDKGFTVTHVRNHCIHVRFLIKRIHQLEAELEKERKRSC